MATKGEWVRYGHEDAPRVGYFAMQEHASSPLPAVLVIQEAWGVDAHIQDVARRFADAGYAVLAPDLFSLDGGKRAPAVTHERITELVAFVDASPPGSAFDADKRAAELAKVQDTSLRSRLTETGEALLGAGGLLQRRAEYVAHLGEAVTFLREQKAETKGRPLGVVGYCMGGGLAGALAAHDSRVSAAVMYYGMAPPPEAAAHVACPMLGFYAGGDARINESVEPFAEAMKAAGKPFEHLTYETAKHAFANDGRPSFHVAATRDAFARTLGFFAHQLVTEKLFEVL
jgi:carboxymethylenebutenolidase